ncbi:sugar nucleotide-binding protein [Paenibacillus lutimineralis]|uniref:dTDP-4-dehydrorhamnose reductase n=1 Tax=Paenibacillus lutimineralis TaxID=2707005 RepID=A0A3Q9IF16_9BACL|nr:sugar nucleotide-binding protein [Paenibacillus lutimineralis]AZS17582.1 NAD-dependent epimerase/dehydratase family protein [Paenibacillus lutimineralis]
MFLTDAQFGGNMRVLLFGATGMLGQAIRKEAIRRGHILFGAARNGEEINVDVNNPVDIITAINEVSPDVIINAAALVNLSECENDPGKAYLVNARPASILSRISLERKIYLIQISTDHYYANDGDNLHQETATIKLVNEYARSKYAGELFALTSPYALVVRTNIVGFRRKLGAPTFIEWVIDSLKNKKQMSLFYDFYTSSIAVSQFSTILFDIIHLNNVYGVFNIASRGVHSKKDFIEALANRFEYQIENPLYCSVHEMSTIQRADSLGLDVSKAEKLLGYYFPEMDQVIDALYLESEEAGT